MPTRIKTDKVPEGYDLDMNVTCAGHFWKYRASPHKGGTIAYFQNLTDLRVWKNQVEEIRAIQAGQPTFADKVNDALNSGDVCPELALRMLDFHSGR